MNAAPPAPSAGDAIRRPFAALAMSALVRAAIALRLPIVLAGLGLMLLAAVAWPRLVADADLLDGLPADDPVARTTSELRALFGAREPLLVVIEAADPQREFELKSFAELFAQIAHDSRFVAATSVRIEPVVQATLLARDSPDLIDFLSPEDCAVLEERLSAAWLEGWLPTLRQRLRLRSGEGAAALRADALQLFAPVRERFLASIIPLRFVPADGYFLSDDRRAIALVLRPRRPSGDLAFCIELRSFLERVESVVFDTPEVRRAFRVHYLGAHARAAAKWRTVVSDTARIVVAGMILMVAFVLLAFRRITALPILGAPWMLVAVGIPGAVGALGVPFPPLSVAGFVLGLAATSVFAVHFYSRAIEEAARPSETSIRRPLAAAAERVGWLHLMLVGLVGLVALASLAGRAPGWTHFAATALASTLLGFLGTYLLLPAFATYIVRHRTHRAVSPRFTNFGLRHVAHAAVRLPALALALAVMATAYLGFHAVTIDGNLDRLWPVAPESEFRAEADEGGESFRLPTAKAQVLVRAPSLREALERNDALYELLRARRDDLNIGTILSLRTLLPSLRSQEQARRRLLALRLDGLEQAARQLALAHDLNFDELIAPSFAWVRSLQDAAVRHPYAEWGALRNDRLVRLVRESLRRDGTRDFVVLTRVFLDGPHAADALEALRLAVEEAIPGASVTASGLIAARLAALLRADVALIGFVLALLMLLFGLVAIRRWRDRLLLVAAGLLWLVALLGAVRLEARALEFVDILLMPMLGVAFAASVAHVLAREQESLERGNPAALLPGESYTDAEAAAMAGAVLAGRPSTIVSLFYLLVFLMMATAEEPLLARVGTTGTLGTVAGLLVAQAVLPALMTLTRAGRRSRLPADAAGAPSPQLP